MSLKIFKNYIANYDWFIAGSVFALVFIGFISLLSSGLGGSYILLEKQIIWFAVGVISMVGASMIDFRIFKTQSGAVLFVYLLAVILLIIVSLTSFRWISIGNIFIQPVELAKITLIILLAKFFSKRHIEIYRIRHLVISGMYAALPAFLVLIQPDLGSALVLSAIWVAIVLFSGMRLRHFVVLIAIGITLSFLGWSFFLAHYQKERIISFINPYSDPRGSGYQVIQSIIAVGSGGVFGKGFGNGTQSHLGFLPESQTDFIFASFAEEWGLIGVVVVIFTFLLLIWRVLWIGMGCADNFSRLYTVGFAALIFVQSTIHIGMNMGILPVTGIPLPFVSYGGSSLVTLFVGIGILQNIKINARRAVEERALDSAYI